MRRLQVLGVVAVLLAADVVDLGGHWVRVAPTAWQCRVDTFAAESADPAVTLEDQQA